MTTKRCFLFLGLTLLLSVPFYIVGALYPVGGLPFGVPISVLMIFVPFVLAVINVWQLEGKVGLTELFKSVVDVRKASPPALVLTAVIMPVVGVASFLSMKISGLPLPAEIHIPLETVPLLALVTFLGAIPEELGWTKTVTAALAKAYGPERAGVIVGSVWAVWHVVPWSLAHTGWWVLGMSVLSVLLRVVMVRIYVFGGMSVFTSLIFHMMLNVVMEVFPNGGSHLNPWIFAAWMLVVVLILRIVEYGRQKRGDSVERTGQK